MSRLASRMRDISPFRVMAILAKARHLETQGRKIVHMEIGEPDFPSPEPVIEAGRLALTRRQTQYTPAAGLGELREAIATHYDRRLGIDIDPRRILVTPGASGALQLVLAALVNPGDRVAISDPGYPCNRNMVTQYGGHPVPIAVSADHRYQFTPDQLATAMQQPLRALMLASPANPTGNLIQLDALRALHSTLAEDDNAMLISDEIYQGLQYDQPLTSALELEGDNLVVINSFSKYFGMTGWRVGWAVAPEWLVEPMERLAQNIYLAAPTPSQHAALAAFSDASVAELERRRGIFHQRRDFLHSALTEIGFLISDLPEGAFYLYADAGEFTDDSLRFCDDLLQDGGVAVTPGADFGDHAASTHVRFAYTTDHENLERGIERIRRYLAAGG